MSQTAERVTRVQELIYELKISEVMTKEVITVNPQCSLNEVKETMRKHRISGVPVVEDGYLVGLVSLERIIKSLERGEIGLVVGERMTRKVQVLFAGESIIHAINKFARYSYGRFPVLDRQGKLVGIITKGDIVRGLLKALEVDYHQKESDLYRPAPLFTELLSDHTTLILRHNVRGKDIGHGGEASSQLKETLKRLGIAPDVVRRVAIATYEAEMNIVLHADEGKIVSEIHPNRLVVKAIDRGPGIPDIEQAMQPGFSTAPEWARELGFGAGMGLNNIERCADDLRIRSTVNEGTRLRIAFQLDSRGQPSVYLPIHTRRIKLKTIKLTIDGKEIETQEGKKILEVALEAGIYIPHLCYLPELQPHAGCRLCLVQIEGWQKRNGLVTSCTQPVEEGMVVYTTTPEAVESRREVLEMILSEHPHLCLSCPRDERCPFFSVCQRDLVVTDSCLICAKHGRCELQKVVDAVGYTRQRFHGERRTFPLVRTNPFLERDWNKCISCGRCVRVCAEIRGVGALAFTKRGKDTVVDTIFGDNLEDTDCHFCGQCVLVCPVGALMKRVNKYVGYPDHAISTICPYCGCGCNIQLEIKDGRIISVAPERNEEVNKDCLCVKGHFAYDYIQSNARLIAPFVKRSGVLTRANWDDALNTVAQRLTRIKEEHGPEAIGIIASAKCTNEENYLSQKLARAVIGTNNIDNCADLCHKPTLEGLAEVFGSAAMTNSIADIEKAGCILVIGSNTTETHPIVALRIKWAVRKGAKLIVANPREIELCRFAHLWLPNKPGTDVALINGIMQVMIEQELWDSSFVEARCEQFDSLVTSLSQYTLERVSEISGVPQGDIVTAARLLATGGRDPEYHTPPVYYNLMHEVGVQGETDSPCIIYGSGITHHSNALNGVYALANLAMLTGCLDREGGGLHPLAGQNNVQGACDMAALPDYLPGYQPLDDEKARHRFKTVWGVETLPEKPGLTLLEMLKAAHEGKLKALYIIGQNPMLSAPDHQYVEQCLEALDFLVVQDIFFTETARLADVVLPGTSFAEKDGTFTNSERRAQRVRRALEPIQEARPDWRIICELAERMQKDKEKAVSFSYAHPSAVMSEINELVPIYGGITYDRLEQGGIQWPCPHSDHPGTPILYRDGFDRGKGKFTPVEYKALDEQPDEEYPYSLIIGRILFHYHLGKMTMHSKGLVRIRPECFLEINPQDAEELGLTDRDMVKVTSRWGEVIIRAKVTDRSQPGQVFTTFHYAEKAVNRLIGHVSEPDKEFPELKTCAVRLERVEEPEKLLAEQVFQAT